MSEVKLNLVDVGNTLVGEVHGSFADRCVAALSAEPETLGELASALARYQRPQDELDPFVALQSSTEVDPNPWDAGLVVIDLAARIVLIDSTYSAPGQKVKLIIMMAPGRLIAQSIIACPTIGYL